MYWYKTFGFISNRDSLMLNRTKLLCFNNFYSGTNICSPSEFNDEGDWHYGVHVNDPTPEAELR
jgi:hypothetical protein